MGRIFVLAASGVFFVGAANATAGERPAFARSGFPITHVQVSVLGSADVQELPPAASLTMQGMPASPHQVAVLTPRRKAAGNEAWSSFRISGSRNATAYRTPHE
jgi:hypothetical protein